MPATLDEIVARFRRTPGDRSIEGSQVEFELRLDRPTAEEFVLLLATLRDSPPGEPGGDELVHSVAAILVEPPLADGLRRQRVRETFLPPGGGERVVRYYRKRDLEHPHQAPGYRVALAVEEPVPPFALDSSALIRFKNRRSFRLAAAGGGQWRVDLTATRRVTGADLQNGQAAALKAAVFGAGGELGPEDLARGCCDYEVEAEYAGPPAEARPAQVQALARSLFQAIDPQHGRAEDYARELAAVAERLAPSVAARAARGGPALTLKAVTPQVSGLTRGQYAKIFPPRGWYLGDKAHGVHAVAHARAGRLVVLADQLYSFAAPGPVPESATLVDGELLLRGEPPVPEFYAFDVMALEGEDLTGRGFEVRVEELPRAAEVLRAHGLAAHAKPFAHLTAREPEALRQAFEAMHGRERPYGIDGLILVEPGRPYQETRTVKWKPAEENTIDFLVRRAPGSHRNADGAELHYLFVGISADLYRSLGLAPCPGYAELFGGPPGAASSRQATYFPIQFSPSSEPQAYHFFPAADSPPLDGLVVEMRRAEGGWVATRVRTDRERDSRSGRYFGNDFRTAELTWLNYIDPFPFEELYSGSAGGYFQTSKGRVYRAQTAYTSSVKGRAIAGLSAAGWVVDLGIGKGQDLGRYLAAGVRHLVGLDQDEKAVAEAVRRKYDHARRAPQQRMSLHTLVADLRRPAAETAGRVRALPGFPPAGADAVVCNLAVHYFADSTEALNNFVALCTALVRPGGEVVVTAMDGERVAERLAGLRPGERWEARSGEALRYAIRRDYRSSRLTLAGQRIGVLLPFSGGEFYEEFLVNFRALGAAFERRKAPLQSRTPFDDPAIDAAFRAGAPDLAAELDEHDRRWLELFTLAVFRRSGGPPRGARGGSEAPAAGLAPRPTAAEVAAAVAEAAGRGADLPAKMTVLVTGAEDLAALARGLPGARFAVLASGREEGVARLAAAVLGLADRVEVVGGRDAAPAGAVEYVDLAAERPAARGVFLARLRPGQAGPRDRTELSRAGCVGVYA